MLTYGKIITLARSQTLFVRRENTTHDRYHIHPHRHRPLSLPNPAICPSRSIGARGVRGTVELDPAYAPGLKDLTGFSRIILSTHFPPHGRLRARGGPVPRQGPARCLCNPGTPPAERDWAFDPQTRRRRGVRRSPSRTWISWTAPRSWTSSPTSRRLTPSPMNGPDGWPDPWKTPAPTLGRSILLTGRARAFIRVPGTGADRWKSTRSRKSLASPSRRRVLPPGSGYLPMPLILLPFSLRYGGDWSYASDTIKIALRQ